MQNVLKDQAFVAKHVGDDVPERKILYEDPELGFCILAHNYQGAKESNPHDHAHSWATTAGDGETQMRRLGQGAGCRRRRSPARSSTAASTRWRPAMAHVYTRAICTPEAGRLDEDHPYRGTNMEKVKRISYEKA